MRRYLFLLLFPLFLNACALCALYTPTVHAKIDFVHDDKNLLGFTSRWIFSENFTKDLLNSYDTNNNHTLDEQELEEVKQTLLIYIKPRNFLMHASFYLTNEEAQTLDLKFKDFTLQYQNQQIIFDFSSSFLVPIQEEMNIKILLQDEEGFFKFKILQTSKLELDNSLLLHANINSDVAFYKISKSKTFELKHLSDIVPKIQPLILEEEIKKEQNYYEKLKNILEEYTNKIKYSLKDLQEENTLKKMSILLGFSFLYGFFHALGPGHGKTLVASYFIANGGDWIKALMFSFRIGIIHVLSAFVLVFTSIYIIKTFVSKLLNDISVYTSYISATIIIIIALFMLFKKFTAQKHHHHEQCCSCSSCNSSKSDWGIAISAGMIPCAGTVVIFILTFTLGSYMIGFLSAIFMAIGMGSVIFVSSVFGQFLHVKIAKNYSKVITFIEYLAILFILMLGVSLLISPLIM